jgi:hypothetical protein
MKNYSIKGKSRYLKAEGYLIFRARRLLIHNSYAREFKAKA